ncbi:MAG: helix-turn-helix domain-containing protein [Pseudohongiellaceae bacterium]
MTKAKPSKQPKSNRTKPSGGASQQQSGALRSAVEKALHRYFQLVEDGPVTDLHDMVMSEVEAPLLETAMRLTGNNQSKASALLGINRGTLRSKLKHYDLL